MRYWCAYPRLKRVRIAIISDAYADEQSFLRRKEQKARDEGKVGVGDTAAVCAAGMTVASSDGGRVVELTVLRCYRARTSERVTGR